MRRKISLYIAGQPVDLDEQSFILFNYTMEDLKNPTIVKNSFSQSITLKGTPRNNKVFGGMWRFDRLNQYGSAYSGVYFDAARKTPFIIYNDMNEIVESGYVKLDEIVRSGDSVEYKISLFGGLGSFFYGLTYDEDGNKKTLADMRYMSLTGYTRIPGHFGQVGGFSMLTEAWSYLLNPSAYDPNVQDCWWCNVINFAPAYNGLPDKFSADKAVCNKPFDNVPNYKYLTREDAAGQSVQVEFSFKTGTQSNLMTFTNPHTEWEIRDLRWYLQRPVISMKAVLDAICDAENNGGWNVEISSLFYDLPECQSSWLTLPLIPAEDRGKADAIVRLLSSTKSPAEYLISFAKMYGLVFLCDSATRKVSVITRREFYREYKTTQIDLTKRVDRKSIKISPIISQSHWYQFGNDAIGEWASQYKADFGIPYGIQKVNTGNDFNSETKVLTSDIIFKEAVEVQERNLLFTSNALTRDEADGVVENFILPMYESVKLQLWGVNPGEEVQTMEELDVLCPYEWERFFINPDYPLSDWLPKVQFHDAGNKGVDGADVLLFLNGIGYTPKWTGWAGLEYRLTDDIPDMGILNDDTPCWNFTETNVRYLSYLPSFRRVMTYIVDEDDVIDSTFEWGNPKARGVNGVFHLSDPRTIYRLWWQKYQQDRFDYDTLKMTCKVDLRGFQVGQDLMRRFFYYDGAVFVLNKIINHSLTTWDDTECEFIKVQDINNYIR